ncbi:MAG: RHS repeat protein [Zoogloeaceae bacterium]|nr:RHS repeat protein [Zoogloeaceae bacterium]
MKDDANQALCVDPATANNNGPTCPSTPRPIAVGSGNKWLAEADITSSLSLNRYYNSSAATIGTVFGPRWRADFTQKLHIESTTGTVRAARVDGKVYAFIKSASIYVPTGDIVDNLYSEVTGYRYHNAADGTVERYDTAGRLNSLTDNRGRAETLTYDAQNRLATVTDTYGHSLQFAYDAQNRINQIVTPAGPLTYTYDTAGNLATVTYPDTRTKTYHYENTSFPNALTGITDENGSRTITYTYDSQGRAVGEVLAGNVGSNQLSFGTNSTTLTDARGTAYTYNFQTILGVVKSTGSSQPGGAGCGPASASLTYDTNGNVSSRTDFNGNVTTYTYDLARNLETKRVEASGKPEAKTTSTQWHSYWRLPTKVAEPNKLTTYIYNGDVDNGNVVTCAPAGATVPSITGGTQPIGVLCKKTEQATADANGSTGFAASVSGVARTSTWTYNQHGQVLTADGPRTDAADTTTYTYYDAADPDMGKRGQLASVTNALGQLTQITSYDLNGNPLTIIDPNGVVTTLTYDARQRLTSRSVGNELTSYQYDGVGQLTQVTLPDSSQLNYTWDPAHRLTGISDSLGNQVIYTLDAMGNRINEEVKDPQGALSRTRARVYDALNRLQTLTGAGNE